MIKLFLFVLFFYASAMAEFRSVGTLQVVRGQLILTNTNGSPIEMKDGEVRITLEDAELSMFHPGDWFQEEHLIFTIKDSQNSFEFRVPKQFNHNPRVFFSSQDSTGQGATLRSSVLQFEKVREQKTKKVTFVEFESGIGFDGTTKSMPINVERNVTTTRNTWKEILTIRVYNERGEVVIKTKPYRNLSQFETIK